MTQLKPGDVENALIDLLKGGLNGADVTGISSDHFDVDGNLVINAPKATVLVYFEDDAPEKPRTTVRTTYDCTQVFMLLCFQQNLRGTADERASTYGLVAQVRDLIAGQRLNLPDGLTAPTIYMGTKLFQFDKRGTWYAVRAGVNAVMQFSDKN